MEDITKTIKEIIKEKTIKRTVEIIEFFTTEPMPEDLILEFIKDFDNTYLEVQTWVINNLKDKFDYATGDSIVEAAYSIASSAIGKCGRGYEGYDDNNR